MLTPNAMLHIQPIYIPELEKHHVHRRERSEKASQTSVKMRTSDVESVDQRIISCPIVLSYLNLRTSYGNW